MSEKQAKKLRKEQPQQKAAAVKKTGSWFNAVLVIVIAAVLALGGYMVYDRYKENHPSTEPETVADRAKTEGITADEFLAKYGIDTVDGVDKDTALSTATGYMTVEKYAEFEGTTVDELKANYGFDDAVTNDMVMNDAQEYVTVSKAAEMSGVDYASMLQMYGLTEEELPQDMLFKDAKPILQAAQEKIMAESEEQADSESDADTEAAE